jgi:prepilin-type N-terminal cleavage/methylation domain-containing protein
VVGIFPEFQKARSYGARGFTLIEVLMAMGVIGVLVLVLYSAIANSAAMTRNCQENSRVTQILSDKMDTVRLYNWAQINVSNNFLLTNFTVGIDPLVPTSKSYYTGSISVVQAPLTERYKSNLLEVSVTVNWVTGKRPQTRSMTTYVTRYGLNSYITHQ